MRISRIFKQCVCHRSCTKPNESICSFVRFQIIDVFLTVPPYENLIFLQQLGLNWHCQMAINVFVNKVMMNFHSPRKSMLRAAYTVLPSSRDLLQRKLQRTAEADDGGGGILRDSTTLPFFRGPSCIYVIDPVWKGRLPSPPPPTTTTGSEGSDSKSALDPLSLCRRY